MKLTLIGCGCGRDSLTGQAQEAIRRAELLLGSARLIEQFPEHPRRAAACSTGEMLEKLRQADCQEAALLFSGDSGFYSGAAPLLRELNGEETALLPGLSSMQILAARLKEPWQDWHLCSAHGRDCDPVAEVCTGRTAFFLTGGRQGPAELCRELDEAGLGFLACAAGENLGTEKEHVSRGCAKEFAARRFDPLSVLLVRPAPRMAYRCPGIPDGSFLREEGIPMTRQETRAVILAKLGVMPEDCCWDIGTGTGSVAVEFAMQARRVYSVERGEGALQLAERNRRRFGAWNLRLVRGTAPEALKGLPRPDAVFVGGSGGTLRRTLCEIHRTNPAARVCVSAVTLETLHTASETMKELGQSPDVTQLAVSRSSAAGGLTMIKAQNPVWLITGTGE